MRTRIDLKVVSGDCENKYCIETSRTFSKSYLQPGYYSAPRALINYFLPSGNIIPVQLHLLFHVVRHHELACVVVQRA
jgi:hypothetical protein